jgi:tRNA-uridine 2-sulfurtransferase
VGADEALHTVELAMENMNWVSVAEPAKPFPAQVKIRHKHEPAAAMVEALVGLTARVRFARPQRAITPGQAAVIYDGDVLLGGGWIK